MLNIKDEEDSIRHKQHTNGYGNSFDSYSDSTTTTTTTSTANTNSSDMASLESSNLSSSSPPPPPPPLIDKQHSFLSDHSNLDIIDLVNNDLINIDQEYLWLCDPKQAQLNNSKSTKFSRMKQDSSDNSLHNHDSNNNNSTTTNNNNNSNNNITNNNNNNTHQNTTNTHTTTSNKSKKNPYKWLMEDFEDKNLDKVKRTLLVALDDISKGFNRRSRSVSTSRTPYMQSHQNGHNYLNYNNNNNNNNNGMYHQPSGQQYYYYQSPNDQEANQYYQQQQQQQMFNDFNELQLRKQIQPVTQVQQSKSIESLLNESNTDHISEEDEEEEESELNRTYSLETESDLKSKLDSIKSNKTQISDTINNKNDSNESNPSTRVETTNLHAEFVKIRSNTHDIIKPSKQQNDQVDDTTRLADTNNTNNQGVKSSRVNNNYSTSYSSATIVKKKHNNNTNNVTKMNNRFVDDANLSTIESIDVSTSEHPTITDSLESNGATTRAANQLDDQQYEDITDVQVIAKMQEETLRQSVLNINKIDKINQQPRAAYNTATIVKRTHNVRPTMQTQNFNYESPNQHQLRRDSASSSDHSSISSTGSPYASHVNVNVGFSSSSKPVSQTNTKRVESRTSSQTPLYQTRTAQQKVLNFTSQTSAPPTPTSGVSGVISSNSSSKLMFSTHSRSTTPSKLANPLTSSNSNILKHDSRLPTPRSRGVDLAQGSTNKPPPSPFQTGQSSNVTATTNTSARTGRTPMAYGGQRSATTSIVPMIASASSTSSLNNGSNQNWQQSKFSKLQKQQPILTKQPQQTIQQQQQQQQQAQRSTTSMSRTSTNQSIASSNSSSNIISTNPTISPSSSSSVSTSSSMHQIAPMNSSSPRSRHTSPLLNTTAHYSHTNSSNTLNYNTNSTPNKIVISPSGLLTDGPLGRSRPLISPSPMRDRSSSPVYEVKKTLHLQQQQQQHQPVQLVNQLNVGSNSSLHTIQESKVPTNSSPMLIKKQTVVPAQQLRKSFLPQPVHLQTQQFHASQSAMDPNNWKDGCY